MKLTDKELAALKALRKEKWALIATTLHTRHKIEFKTLWTLKAKGLVRTDAPRNRPARWGITAKGRAEYLTKDSKSSNFRKIKPKKKLVRKTTIRAIKGKLTRKK